MRRTITGLLGFLMLTLAAGTAHAQEPEAKVLPSPQPVDRADLDGDALLTYLGHPADHPALTDLVATLGEPAVEEPVPGLRVLTYANLGLSLVFYLGRLEEMSFYGVGVSGMSLYPGKLPKELLMAEGRALTGQRLGVPEEVRSQPGSAWTLVRYPGLGVDAFFARDTTRALIYRSEG